MKDAELLDQIQRKKAEDYQVIRSELGEILDTADLLHHHAERWYEHACQHRPIPKSLMENPFACREAVLQVMAKESMNTSWELCQVYSAGAFRSTQWLFRKQFETLTNSLFISLDETGETAQIYHHLQLINQAKLDPEDEDFHRMRQLSAEFLRSKGIDIKSRNARNAWTKAANGKTYAGLVSRFTYVMKQLGDTWTDEMNQEYIKWYSKSNTIVHPSLLGHANMIDYRFIIVSNFMSLRTVLNQYRQAAMLDMPFAAYTDAEELWKRLSDPYDRISSALIDKI